MFLVVTPGTGDRKQAIRKESVGTVLELERGCRIVPVGEKFGMDVQESFHEIVSQLGE